ncbi:MAG: methionine adenosyltransferase domain-containing protein, partial [candidate division WOR-3 bacterium]
LQIAYAIGVAEPVALAVNTYNTGRISEEEIVRIIKEIFDFTPQGIIDRLELRRPIYKKTSVYGHFGREDEGFPWEFCDSVEILKREARLK